MHKSLNGKIIKMTEEEITALEADRTKVTEEMKIIDDTLKKKTETKISAKQKLKELGLTDDEVEALLGAISELVLQMVSTVSLMIYHQALTDQK